MIWDLITGLLPNVWPYIAGLGLAVVAYFTGRSKGGATVRRKQAEANVKAVERGVKGAAKATKAISEGAAPQEVKEANDARWN